MKKIVSLFRNNAANFILYECIFKAGSSVLFLPLFWKTFQVLMNVTGYSYLTSANILSFLLHPLNFIFVLFMLIVLSFVSLADISGLLYIAGCSFNEQKASLSNSFIFAFQQAKRIFSFKNFPLVIYMLLILPLLNIGLSSSLLSIIKIPNFVQESIAASSSLFILAVSLYILFALFMIRFLFVLPIFVLEQKDFLDSCKKSWRITKKKAVKNILYYIAMQIGFSIAAGLLFVLLFGLLWLVVMALSLVHVPRWILFDLFFSDITLLYFIFANIALPFSYLVIVSLYFRESSFLWHGMLETRSKEWITVKRAVVFSLCAFMVLGFVIYRNPQNFSFQRVPPVQISAHRGASRYAPENTLAAFEKAKELGADWIELDVQQTKDRVLIISHDTSLKRVTGKNVKIADTNYEDIKNLDAGSFFDPSYSGEKIPTISQVLDFAKKADIKLIIEIKAQKSDVDLEKDLVHQIKQYNFQDHCCISSFSADSLKKVKSLDPSIKTLQLLSFALGDVAKLDYADYFGIEEGSITKRLCSLVHEQNKEIFVWTVNHRENMEKMIELGADNLITDDILLAREVIYNQQYNPQIQPIFTLFESAIKENS